MATLMLKDIAKVGRINKSCCYPDAKQILLRFEGEKDFDVKRMLQRFIIKDKWILWPPYWPYVKRMLTRFG